MSRQWTGDELYEQQQRVRALGLPPAPHVVASGLTTPENLGGVLRVADAAGSAGVLFMGQDPGAAERMRRVARNASHHVPWRFGTEDELDAPALRPLIGLELATGSKSLFDAELPPSCALLIGGERHGIADRLLMRCDAVVHVPMFGVNGSMNVTHALAIALFEWRRRFSHERR